MKRFLRAAALAIGSAGIASPAAAQDASAPPPCQHEIYRAFDFWLGDWEVFTPDGKKAGVNKISEKEGGCLLLEEWTSAGGGTGQSYNYYDPGLKKWRQIWVSGASTINYSGGLSEDGEMVLEGEIAYRNGTTAPFKGTWTLLEDGSVRQHFEQFDADKKEWNDWFVGIYKKPAKQN